MRYYESPGCPRLVLVSEAALGFSNWTEWLEILCDLGSLQCSQQYRAVFWFCVSMVTSCFISHWLQIFIPISSSFLEQIVCHVNYVRKFFCLSLLWRMYHGCLLSQEYDSVSHFWNFLFYLFLLFLNLSSPKSKLNL